MNITLLPSNKLLRGDLVEQVIIRSDLTPVPQTIEITCRVDPEIINLIKEGSTVKAGRDNAEYLIIKVINKGDVLGVQGSRLYGAIVFIGILKSVHQVAFIQQSAVIKKNSSIGTIYRACGATAKISKDFHVGLFACFTGDYPSTHIARLLQEEQATVYWTGESLNFIRLPDLFSQDPVKKIGAGAAEDIKSGFIERHEIPAFYSVDDNGNILAGETKKIRNARYIPRTDERQLKNLTKVLVKRKILRSAFAPMYNAGNLFEVEGSKLAVITAAHVTDKSNTYSKFWLGSLE